MSLQVRRRLLTTLVIVASLLLTAHAADAQKSSINLQWDRWDVTIDNIITSSNRFDVTETHILSIFQGPVHFGYRDIPETRLEKIDDVTASDNDVVLRQDCSQAAGTVCLTTTSDNYYRIQYYFAETVNSGTHTIVMKYRVYGALRSFVDGDELAWKALADDRPFPVQASTVTVIMPEGRSPLQYGANPATWHLSRNGNTLVWKSPGSLGTKDNVEVGVKYPHDPEMRPPSWQQTGNNRAGYANRVISFILMVVLAWWLLFMTS